jgi:hypothetical protein
MGDIPKKKSLSELLGANANPLSKMPRKAPSFQAQVANRAHRSGPG